MVKKAKKIVKEPQVIEETPAPQKQLLTPISPKLLKPLLYVVGFILITGSVGTALYFYNQYQTTQKLLKNPNQASEMEVNSIISKVGKLMELPTGEIPQLATVVDKTKLTGQPFFARAQNGDKVVLYTKSKRAILYRPSTNKIIEVAPLSVSDPAPQEQGNVAGASTKAVSQLSPTSIPENVRIVVINGTIESKLAAHLQQQITTKYPTYTVSLGNANLKNYTGIHVYSLNGKDSQAEAIATLLGGKVEQNIPEGEATPDADILVIAGK